MSDFSFWVILSNLLLATRWTILLSLIAFVSGGIVALALLFARVSGKPWLERLTRATGWQHRLDALETEVYRTRRERRTAAGRRQTQEKTA